MLFMESGEYGIVHVPPDCSLFEQGHVSYNRKQGGEAEPINLARNSNVKMHHRSEADVTYRLYFM